MTHHRSSAADWKTTHFFKMLMQGYFFPAKKSITSQIIISLWTIEKNVFSNMQYVKNWNLLSPFPEKGSFSFFSSYLGMTPTQRQRRESRGREDGVPTSRFEPRTQNSEVRSAPQSLVHSGKCNRYRLQPIPLCFLKFFGFFLVVPTNIDLSFLTTNCFHL